MFNRLFAKLKTFFNRTLRKPVYIAVPEYSSHVIAESYSKQRLISLIDEARLMKCIPHNQDVMIYKSIGFVQQGR